MSDPSPRQRSPTTTPSPNPTSDLSKTDLSDDNLFQDPPPAIDQQRPERQWLTSFVDRHLSGTATAEENSIHYTNITVKLPRQIIGNKQRANRKYGSVINKLELTLTLLAPSDLN